MANEPFTVTVHGGFAEDGVWVIDARIVWAGDPPPVGSRLLGLGRLALLEAITREGERGRSLGAKEVRVAMEGHDSVKVTLG